MRLLAIDPGPDTSGVVLLNHTPDVWPPRVVWHQRAMSLDKLRKDIADQRPDIVVCEWISSMGMVVGASVFNTCRIVGRIEQMCEDWGVRFRMMKRVDVKLAICGSMRAKDKNIRAALLDMYPQTGGGKTPAIGTQPRPGPLYGLTSHSVAALAVGVAWLQEEWMP